jgi:hypothetical protein
VAGKDALPQRDFVKCRGHTDLNQPKSPHIPADRAKTSDKPEPLFNPFFAEV